MSHCYLYIDIPEQRATIVRLPEQSEGLQPEGRVYEDVDDMLSLISTVLDVSHGDADGILMGSDLQSRDWVLEGIECEWYVTLRRVPEIGTMLPRTADFDLADTRLLERIRDAIAVKAKERPN